MQQFPLVRTDAQARLLGVLFERQGVQRPLGQLARRAGVPGPTASKEIDRLEAMGLVRSSAMGRMRLVSANWDLPWASELASILDQTVGVVAHVERALGRLPGVEQAFLFGSWAAREASGSAPDPRDLDLLVVGHTDYEDIRTAMKPVEERVGLFVDPTVIDPDRWRRADDPFVATVKDRPLRPLRLRTLAER